MNNLRPLLISSAFLALTAVSAAQADPAAGSYKLAIGASTCPITLSADGKASYTAECAQGSDVARWHAKFNGLELQTASGETVAVLKAKDGAYAGTRYADGRSVVLSADGSAVALSH